MQEVLFMGPDYREHRGGIGAVLATYSAHIRPFKFIPTYNNTPPLSRNILFLKAVFRLIWLMSTDSDIRIVHLHSAQKGSFIRKSILMRISQVFGRKAVLHMHASGFDHYYKNAGSVRKYIRYIFTKADLVICLSEKWKEYYASHFTIRKLVILNNVIDRPEFRSPATVEQGPVKLLFLGLIGPRKGLFDLLETLKNNDELFAGKYTLMIGGNGEVKRLEDTLEAMHTDGQIRFGGWITGEEKNRLLTECDIYILPSHNEGLPISILEAMAYGKPIISTYVGGIPEIVKPGYNGWLFNAGNQEELKKVLTEALNNKTILLEYGKNSYALTGNYTPDAVLNSLQDIYKQVLN